MRRIASGLVVLLVVAAPGHAGAQPTPADTLREVLERSRAAGDSAAMAEALNALGLQFWSGARFDSAAAYLGQARDVWAARHDSLGLGRAYNNLGVTYYQWGHLPLALDSYLRSVAVRRSLGDARGTALALTNISGTYRAWGLFERGRAVLDEAVAESDASGDAFVRAYARHNLGLLFLEQGDAEGAREAFEQSLRIFQEPGTSLTPIQVSDGVGANRVGLARVRLLAGDPGAAVTTLEEILGTGGEEATSGRQAETLIALGKAYLATGASGQALHTFERALEFSRESGQRSRALEALLALTEGYERRGDLPAALLHARLSRSLGDSLAVERGVREAAAVENRIAAERDAAENQALREERQAREAVIARQGIGFVLGGLLLVVSVALIAVLIHFNRRGREREILLTSANAALEGANQELRLALSEVRTLEGLIPICARCKRVRDESGYWESVETYIASRSDALFSHGICNECGQELYGDDWASPPPSTEPAPADAAAGVVTPLAPDGPPRSR
ncbi:MAG TPA: tetratricopeptide repeat protein [Longimicrobiales bacterium]|nr:tetratricopeptide repeat protein [Longimicrobiales bacterium]